MKFLELMKSLKIVNNPLNDQVSYIIALLLDKSLNFMDKKFILIQKNLFAYNQKNEELIEKKVEFL